MIEITSFFSFWDWVFTGNTDWGGGEAHLLVVELMRKKKRRVIL
jgi:hypothetical protein